MRRAHGKGLSNDLSKLLHEARSTPVTDNHDTIATRIAKGQLTRDRACDGKIRFKTYGFADMVARENGPGYGKEFRVYACPFCSGWHLASVTEIAS